MQRVKFILIISTLFVSSIYGENLKKIRWYEIPTKWNEELKFVSGKNSEDFWVQTLSGTLLNIKQKKIKEFQIPKKFQFIKTVYYQISENDFFCSATTTEWKGEIYRVKNHVWTKYKFENPYPIRFILKTLDDNYYIIGDFGTLLKFTNNDWETIQTPFDSHIIEAVVNKNNLYMVTRNNGIILFDGKHFKTISSPEINKHIISIKFVNGILYGLSSNNKLFSYKNDIEQSIDDNEILDMFITNNKNSKFGFSDKIVFKNGKKNLLYYPQNYNIESITVLDDNSYLLFSNNGNIYISEILDNNYFINLAQIYRIDDFANSDITGTQFFDANQDGVNDLIVFNKNYGNYISLFRGVSNAAYANITSITDLPFNENPISNFTISDFNEDDLPDLILQTKLESGQAIIFYKNLGRFKFEKADEILLPKDFQNFGIRDLSTFDYDKDGDDDLIVTSYYGAEDNPGYVLIYKNNYWGNFGEIDTSLVSITKHWNEKIIFADLTNNDTLDIFNATSWANDHLLLGTRNGFEDKSSINFIRQKKTETVDAQLIDFDNDGDLDIFTVGRNDFIRVYSNDGHGFFSEITSTLFDKRFLEKTNLRYGINLNCGDFNNDKFVDILVSLVFSDSSYTTFFFNNNGKFFNEVPIYSESNNKLIQSSTISDFDNDGDLDVYGATKSNNIFWINTLDDNNFIKIRLNGIISSNSAVGSKIWVYEENKLNDKNYLIGYKQLGADGIAINRANDLTVHFGLGQIGKCDIKIKFLSGKEVILIGVKAGSFLTINETNSLNAFIYNLPGEIYRFAINSKNQIYATLILLSHVILILGIWFGHTKLSWSTKLTIIFTIMNISLFWGSLYFSSFSHNNSIKYLIPLMLTIIVTISPLALFYWLNKTTKKNIVNYKEKLLRLIMTFSHGEWALRNLNSIILLCENPPLNWETNSEFTSKLKTRLLTFLNMTSSSISEIIEYEKLIGNNSDELLSLDLISNEVVKNVKENINSIDKLKLNKLVDNFSNIRNSIKELRTSIYLEYSSNPTEVINNLIINYENILNDQSIEIEKTKLYKQEIDVLVKSYELGNILDNLFQNSIRFMKNTTNKKIIINLYKESPKIIIEFSNNGSLLEKDKWEIIFEQGYSESHSTGQGLFLAREILSKYSGRINVSRSDLELTTFKIELNEVVIST